MPLQDHVGEQSVREHLAKKSKFQRMDAEERKKQPCKTYKAGKCGRGLQCSFMHAGEGKDERAEAKKYKCNHKRDERTGKCIYGNRCMYDLSDQ